MDGRELAGRLAVEHPALEVLYVSGYTDDAIARHGVLAAGVELLHKPFTPATLARRVREILDKKVAQRSWTGQCCAPYRRQITDNPVTPRTLERYGAG